MPEIAYFVLGDFPCSIWKHPDLGTLQGYLGVSPIHPWYGKDQSDDLLRRLDVHGGITLACHEKSSRQMSPEYRAAVMSDVRPFPEFEWVSVPNKDDASWPHNTGQDVWWVGFDCGHLHDFVPATPRPGDVYRDEHYVRNELEGLAHQAAAAMQVEVLGGTPQ